MLFCHSMFMRSLLDLLYPPACLLCQARLSDFDTPVCGRCQAACERPKPPLCVRCGLSIPASWDAQLPCAACREHTPSFEKARAPWCYTGAILQAVHGFKYGRRQRLGDWLADEMAQIARTELARDQDIDAVLCVPAHWMKSWWRGANPAAALAQRVSKRLDKPLVRGALKQKRFTRSQTRLSRKARERNVSANLQADGRSLLGRRVLLVDDVFTTGATANACAQALKQAGAKTVFVISAARTPKIENIKSESRS